MLVQHDGSVTPCTCKFVGPSPISTLWVTNVFFAPFWVGFHEKRDGRECSTASWCCISIEKISTVLLFFYPWGNLVFRIWKTQAHMQIQVRGIFGVRAQGQPVHSNPGAVGFKILAQGPKDDIITVPDMGFEPTFGTQAQITTLPRYTQLQATQNA